MLVLKRGLDQSVTIGGLDESCPKIEVQIVDVRRDGSVRLGIKAPKDVPVYRQEVYERIEREKRAA